ncbi:hypothetical protein KFK09_010189 [Dendrobium nobile]|uniref:DUF4378 domain-containing protein n=1 Tax=Dendrobium nobile TaxID=94219 RepID=A0A8T3BM89_DENNO|nr:hypothetical protein KFK09_010189 [Dendrobium nobile]
MVANNLFSCSACSLTRIVILKPGSDMKDEMEVPWHGSLAVAKKGGSMEDFLEEVKERLRLEIEGKGKNGSIRRLGVGHTSLHESSADAKQQAREAAKDGAMLRRSQSLITCRSVLHFDEHESSKSSKRETKKFIYDRLKNVLKDDTEMKEPMLEDENFGKLLSEKETAISRSVSSFSKEENNVSFWEEKKAVNESIPKHLRHEHIKMVPLSDEAMSLSNFDGSFFSSGTGSAKVGRVATEAQNFQKHEASKNDSAAVKKRKKDVFSIKSTFSNLKRNLGLRGNFFGKKASSMGESTVDIVHHDNLTEVPPASPASFPCSPINEHHSPVSPFEDPFGDGHSSTQVSEHVENERCGMATQTRLHESNETILTEGCGEAYVRDILVVSGLYRAGLPLYQAISKMNGQIQIYSNPKVEQPQSIDDIVVWDLKLMPLLTAAHEDISSLGREIEWMIMRELIDGLLSELLV